MQIFIFWVTMIILFLLAVGMLTYLLTETNNENWRSRFSIFIGSISFALMSAWGIALYIWRYLDIYGNITTKTNLTLNFFILLFVIYAYIFLTIVLAHFKKKRRIKQ